MNGTTSLIIIDFVYKYVDMILKVWIAILAIFVLYKINKYLKKKLF